MFKLLRKINLMEGIFIALSVVFILIQVGLELEIPDYMSEITTLLQTGNASTREILIPGGMMVFLSIVSFAASIITGYFAAYVTASLTGRLRGDVYHHIMNLSTREMNHFSIPSLITRTTNDITQIQMLLATGLQVVIRGPIMAVWALTKIANRSWQWTIATGVAIILLLILLVLILIFVMTKYNVIQDLTDKINGLTRENLQGIRVVRAYNAENFQHEKFGAENDNLTKLNLYTNRRMAMMNPGMNLILLGLTLAIYWMGAYMIESADGMAKVTLFSEMIVFSSYAMQIIMGFFYMLFIFLVLPRAMVSARRINEVLDASPSVEFVNQECDRRNNFGKVEFNHVSFTYPDATEAVLKDISFCAKKGETVAFIGATGSGKSSLINLLPRFFDASEGEIKVDGQNIKEYSHEELNNIIAYIPQKSVLFSGTIRSNIDFGESHEQELDDNKIYEALEIAQAKDFVESKEEQLDSHVAQNGANFSGGQKQRLAIARAIARNPEILIFDDSFSALDYRTDKKLRDILAKQVSDATKLIVAQRISTIMDADQIIVLDDGEIVGKGTHAQLLQSNEIYQEIAYSQLSKEELANG